MKLKRLASWLVNLMSNSNSFPHGSSSERISRDEIANENSRYGADPDHIWDDPECRLRINGVEYSKLLDYCRRNNLSTKGDIYDTVINDLKSKGHLV